MASSDISTTASISSDSSSLLLNPQLQNTRSEADTANEFRSFPDLNVQNERNSAILTAVSTENLPHANTTNEEIATRATTSEPLTRETTSEPLTRENQLVYTDMEGIRSILVEFHGKIEDSQRTLRDNILDSVKDIMMNDIYHPLKTSIVTANQKIEELEQNHMQKIEANSSLIRNTKQELDSKIQELQRQLASRPPPTMPQSTPSVNPSMIGRLNNIVISGVAEEVGENLTLKITNIASALQCDIQSFKAKRLGTASTGKTRSILVQLSSFWDRKTLYAARNRLKRNEATKNIYFNEDLDKVQSSLYYHGRQAKKQGLIKSVWTYGGQVFISQHGQTAPIALTSEAQIPINATSTRPLAAATPTTAQSGANTASTGLTAAPTAQPRAPATPISPSNEQSAATWGEQVNQQQQPQASHQQ